METSEFEGGNEYPQNPEHLAIAMTHVNRLLIADDVLRRLPPSNSRKFDFWEYEESDQFTIPDGMEVGKFSSVPEIRPKATKTDSSVKNYGIVEPVSQEDIDDHSAGVDPLARATMRCSNLVKLAREVRVANLVFNAATYASTNKDTLSGTSQFSHTSSDPIVQLKEYLDGMKMRPTKMIIGRRPWTKMSTHAKVVKASNGNAGDAGVANRRVVADLLEIQEIIVGEAFVNGAVKGQTMTNERAWGNYIALLFDDPTADNVGGLTFGFTYQYKGPVVKTFGKPEVGLHGAQKQLVGESVREVISAPSCGFLISSVIA